MGNTHLSEAEESQIRNDVARELFREQARIELIRHNYRWPRRVLQWSWAKANSQVGGWLLSSVLVGFGVWLYGQYTEYSRAESARSELRDKIANEVAFHIRVYNRVRETQITQHQEQQTDLQKRRTALEPTYPPGIIYPQFADRSLVSLLWELAFLCDKRETKRSLQSYAQAFGDNLAVQSISSAEKAQELDKLVQALEKIIEDLVHSAS